MRMKRSDMKPGTIFVNHTRWWPYEANALVVVDKLTEVDFWHGGMWVLGDVMPAIEFEVLS